MIKKVIKVALIGLGIVVLIFCMLLFIVFLMDVGMIKTEEEKLRISVKYTPGEKTTRVKEDEIPDSEYQSTLEEALLHSGVEGEAYQKQIDEIIKSWENDQYMLVFFRSVRDKNEECFTMAKFKKKLIDGKMRYVFVTGIPECYERGELFISSRKESVSGQLTFSDYMQNINIHSQNTRFIYGESKFKEIKNLEVEGQEPTEIVPYEVFGETWYLWYYEEFKSEKSGSTLEFTF